METSKGEEQPSLSDCEEEGEEALIAKLGELDLRRKEGDAQPESARVKDQPSLAAVEEILRYQFNDKRLLEEALTHQSFAGKSFCYERLEYVGDSVLNFLFAKELYLLYPGLAPGSLTRLRAANVDTEKLARVAIKLGLHRYLRHRKPILGEQFLHDTLFQSLSIASLAENVVNAMRNLLLGVHVGRADAGKSGYWKYNSFGKKQIERRPSLPCTPTSSSKTASPQARASSRNLLSLNLDCKISSTSLWLGWSSTRVDSGSESPSFSTYIELSQFNDDPFLVFSLMIRILLPQFAAIQEFKREILDYPLHSSGLIDVPKSLADIVESIIGAVFIDCNFSVDTVWKVFKSLLEPMISPTTFTLHPVSELYELCQKKCVKLSFVDLWSESSSFIVFANDQLVGRGAYKPKKEIALNRAAKDALQNIERLLGDKESNGQNDSELKQL